MDAYAEFYDCVRDNSYEHSYLFGPEGSAQRPQQVGVGPDTLFPKSLREAINDSRNYMMGLFPEIGRAWVSLERDGGYDLVLWDFEGDQGASSRAPQEADPRDPYNHPAIHVLAGFPSLVIGCALVVPRGDRFDTSRASAATAVATSYILVLSTVSRVYLFSLEFSGRGVGSKLQRLLGPHFSETTDGVVLAAFAGTPTGRIFAAGANGFVYELALEAFAGEAGDSLNIAGAIAATFNFAGKAASALLSLGSSTESGAGGGMRLINLTQSYLLSALESIPVLGTWMSKNPAITFLVHDHERGILYALRMDELTIDAFSTVPRSGGSGSSEKPQAYSIPQGAAFDSFSCIKGSPLAPAKVAQRAMDSSGLNPIPAPDAPCMRSPIVSLSIVPCAESRWVHAVAVNRAGVRFYLSTCVEAGGAGAAGGAINPISAGEELRVVYVRLPPDVMPSQSTGCPAEGGLRGGSIINACAIAGTEHTILPISFSEQGTAGGAGGGAPMPPTRPVLVLISTSYTHASEFVGGAAGGQPPAAAAAGYGAVGPTSPALRSEAHPAFSETVSIQQERFFCEDDIEVLACAAVPQLEAAMLWEGSFAPSGALVLAPPSSGEDSLVDGSEGGGAAIAPMPWRAAEVREGKGFRGVLEALSFDAAASVGTDKRGGGSGKKRSRGGGGGGGTLGMFGVEGFAGGVGGGDSPSVLAPQDALSDSGIPPYASHAVRRMLWGEGAGRGSPPLGRWARCGAFPGSPPPLGILSRWVVLTQRGVKRLHATPPISHLEALLRGWREKSNPQRAYSELSKIDPRLRTKLGATPEAQAAAVRAMEAARAAGGGGAPSLRSLAWRGCPLRPSILWRTFWQCVPRRSFSQCSLRSPRALGGMGVARVVRCPTFPWAQGP